MAIPAAAKIGGAGVVAAGAPTTAYFAKDHIFLYQIERDVINGEDKLTVGNPSSDSNDIKIEITINSSTKWSCTIKAEIVDESGSSTTDANAKNKLKKYLEKQLPSTSSDSNSDPKVEDDVKKSNKKKLVWDCSGNRTSISESTIATELSVKLKKTSDKLTTTLFGSESELKES